MRDTLVAIDIESTGLDLSTEQIIEIAAVRFHDGEVLDSWTTLVNPGHPIPPFITRLTGITDDDVKGSPRIREVLAGLRRFVGSSPLVGHNIRFDVDFLNKSDANLSNPLIDTYALASVLLPAAPRYSLGGLAAELDIEVEQAHRALSDVYTTVALYQHLWEKVLALPLDTLAEIVRNGKQMPWDAALVFEEAMAPRAREAFTSGKREGAPAFGDSQINLFKTSRSDRSGLTPAQERRSIDLDQAVAAIEPDGPLSAVIDSYEYRPQQAKMLREVGAALNESRHLLIEAPTGVGKSLAYLVPAARFATDNSERVVISTNTINLQEQLVTKDIPLLIEALGSPVRYAVLKGRSNYLCPRRLAALRRRGPTSPIEMLMLAKLLIWLNEGGSGDRGQLTLRGASEFSIWNRLSAEDEGCSTERCAVQMGGECPFYIAKQRAETAHLLIVNHALLLSDIVTGGRVLPEYRHLVIDEAHHLEDAITNSLSFRAEAGIIQRQIADLGSQNSGLFGELLRQCQAGLPEAYYLTIQEYVELVIGVSSVMKHHVDYFFNLLKEFIEQHTRIPRNEYTHRVRIQSPLRVQPGWADIEISWDNLSKFTGGLAEAMDRLSTGLLELKNYDIDNFDDLVGGVSAAARYFIDLHNRLGELVLEPDANTVYWVEFSANGDRISVHTAPLDIGPMVQKHLWNTKDSVILTSATIRSDDSFAFIVDQLDAEGFDEVVITSPFDYRSNALLYVVNDIPEPTSQQAYQSAVERGILDLCLATEGRAMVLFTSYAQLRATVHTIGSDLEKAGITIYDQTEGVSRSSMLEGFISSEKAVLFGTRSFWEGVDVPGADLSVVVIVRLPFSVPSDPIFAARSELYDDSFNNFALPETILRFRQGFGRLIRRKTDRGIVVIMDRRIISKNYGHRFLQSLPDCKVMCGSLRDLPESAVRWLESTHIQ
nr:DEAD/DEAH box helicase family protein [Anaerolineae bacterium]